MMDMREQLCNLLFFFGTYPMRRVKKHWEEAFMREKHFGERARRMAVNFFLRKNRSREEEEEIEPGAKKRDFGRDRMKEILQRSYVQAIIRVHKT